IGKYLKTETVVHFYNAGFLAGMNRLDEASKELEAAQNLPEFSKEISTLKTEINQRQATGRYTILFDRQNLPLATRSLKGDTAVLIAPLNPLLSSPTFGYLAGHKDSDAQAVLTLDYRIQNAATQALGKYAGAVVVLDIKTGDILAAASNT